MSKPMSMDKKTLSLMIVLIAALCLAVGVTAVEPAKTETAVSRQPVGTMPAPVTIVSFDCTVQGTPTEFPADNYIKNTGNTAAVKGTRLSWAIPNTTRKGTLTLSADMAPGTGKIVSGVIPGGTAAGVKCTVKVVERTMTRAPVSAGAVTQQPLQLAHSFNCTVQGNPTEFPDDIYIQNTGQTAVAQGKVLHWSIPNTTRQGNHTLASELGAGKGISLSGVIGGGMSAGVKCNVTVK